MQQDVIAPLARPAKPRGQNGAARLTKVDPLSAPSLPQPQFERRPLDWEHLEENPPAERLWFAPGWLGPNQTALMAGAAGVGKSLCIQQIVSEQALGRSGILPAPDRKLTVLGWFSEDDIDELARRQVRIAKHLGVPLSDFRGRLHFESLDGRDATLADRVGGHFSATPLLDELRAQVHDYRADIVVLDNMARMFGEDENRRHEVTTFAAMLRGAVGSAALVLLSHPAKAAGSEFSGSTAWEAAVRSRWYLGRKLPDDKANGSEDEGREDDTTRWLCRRKANYSARDYVQLEYREGVFVPDRPDDAGDGALMRSLRAKRAARVIVEGFRRIQETGKAASDATTSPNYLPRLIVQMGLAENCTKQELADALNAAMLDGTFKRGQVGQYANRTPKEGLVMVEPGAA